MKCILWSLTFYMLFNLAVQGIVYKEDEYFDVFAIKVKWDPPDR